MNIKHPIARMLRRWLDRPTPDDGIAETLSITVRCARRCAYDLSHALDLIPESAGRPYRNVIEHLSRNAEHWQKLFSSGASMKDYRLSLHRVIEEQDATIKKLRTRLQALGESEFLDHEVPF